MIPGSVDLSVVVGGLQWLFLAFFIGANGGQLILHLLSLLSIRGYLESRILDSLPSAASGYEPPVSIVVPACNQQARIVEAVRALLRLEYPEYELIVVNDGSRDRTLAVLEQAFGLALFPQAYWRRLKVKPLHGTYRSPAVSNLRVIDKMHGGTADALNAGINAARYPLVCVVDADSILGRDSLRRLVQPFLDNPATVAAGSALRVANGCQVTDGFIGRAGLPANPLAMLQIVEYLRSLVFGRLGWAAFNAVTSVSGALALWRKDAVIAAGGYRNGGMGEDAEMALWLHRLNRVVQEKPYRIVLVPDPIVWIRVPESLSALMRQRANWQRGLARSLQLNLAQLFHPRGGAVGWIALPFVALFEFLGPLLEVSGYLLVTTGFALGLIPAKVFAALLCVAAGLGIVVSLSALLLEELSFRPYRRAAELSLLMAAALFENLGYRQLVALWRLGGLLDWLARGSSRRELTPPASRPPADESGERR
jgi:cellulose synthase/poly-beta-1,6-N-acetylglucosamine synthase-like glycosyltransferase